MWEIVCSALIYSPLLGGVGPPPCLRQPVLQGVDVLLPAVAVALDLSAVLVEVLLRRLQLLGRRPQLLLALGQLVPHFLYIGRRQKKLFIDFQKLKAAKICNFISSNKKLQHL